MQSFKVEFISSPSSASEWLVFTYHKVILIDKFKTEFWFGEINTLVTSTTYFWRSQWRWNLNIYNYNYYKILAFLLCIFYYSARDRIERKKNHVINLSSWRINLSRRIIVKSTFFKKLDWAISFWQFLLNNSVWYQLFVARSVGYRTQDAFRFQK